VNRYGQSTWMRAHAVLIYAFLYLPIVILVIFSFSNSRYSAVWSGFTWKWYGAVFRNERLMEAALNSLVVATSATLIATVLGTLAAFGLYRYRFRGHTLFQSILVLPLVMPEVVQGIALLLLFVLVLQLPLSLITVVLAHSVFCLAYVAVVVGARLQGLDWSLVEAAADLGATPVQVFRRILLPVLWPGIAGGALLAFTISFDDFVIAYFVAGPGVYTLPIEIYAMVKRGVTPEINALASVILLLSMVLVSASLLIQRVRR